MLQFAKLYFVKMLRARIRQTPKFPDIRYIVNKMSGIYYGLDIYLLINVCIIGASLR